MRPRWRPFLQSAGITNEQVHHGYDIDCWAVNARALGGGHGIRTGLEDVTVLEDGTPARDNAELVAAAVQLIRRAPAPTRHDDAAGA